MPVLLCISNCCSWFLTKPTIYVVQIKISATFCSWGWIPPCFIEDFLTLGVQSVPCNVDVGGSNEMWRYDRSEIRPSHYNSKYGHEGKQGSVFNVMARKCLRCHVAYLSRECSQLSNCCAWFLTIPANRAQGKAFTGQAFIQNLTRLSALVSRWPIHHLFLRYFVNSNRSCGDQVWNFLDTIMIITSNTRYKRNTWEVKHP
jgi:hypothetical protein